MLQSNLTKTSFWNIQVYIYVIPLFISNCVNNVIQKHCTVLRKAILRVI